MIEHSPRTVRRIAGPEKLTCGLSGEMPDQDGHGVLNLVMTASAPARRVAVPRARCPRRKLVPGRHRP